MGQYFKIVTLGCAKNSVDSEQLYSLLSRNDFQPTAQLTEAEIIILNTCGFITDAKQESIEMILELAKYKKRGNCKCLVMIGCLVQKYVSELKAVLPEVDIFLGSGDLLKLPELLAGFSAGEKIVLVTQPENYLYDDCLPRNYKLQRSYAYVKIAEGCNNFCTYCVIPEMRGVYRSRPLTSIVNEVKALTEHGISEIILIAQDTTYYGQDLSGEYLLPELLRQLVKLPKLKWLRLHYCYPEHLTTELLELIQREKKICKYLDIPLQHIADPILKAMGRSFDNKKIKHLLAKIKKIIPGITLRSTFIVGFPGETEAHFKELLNFLQETKFARAGFFAYSREPNTPAARLPEQINPQLKLERLQKATSLQSKILAHSLAAYLGQKVHIIVDGPSSEYEGLWEGRMASDSPEIDCLVYFKPQIRLKIGDFIKVSITHSRDYALLGEIINEFGQ
ncbi:MAG TPA: 30S ribosomal protein S12 methylthiotransferase RimO [Clostridia bacterium]|nr:30S ribosomal protein S12 methylthiotransferase RimO [Clostridia bacterium]